MVLDLPISFQKLLHHKTNAQLVPKTPRKERTHQTNSQMGRPLVCTIEPEMPPSTIGISLVHYNSISWLKPHEQSTVSKNSLKIIDECLVGIDSKRKERCLSSERGTGLISGTMKGNNFTKSRSEETLTRFR